MTGWDSLRRNLPGVMQMMVPMPRPTTMRCGAIGLLGLAACCLLLAPPARAQSQTQTPSINLMPDKYVDPETEAKRSEIDQAYRRANQKIQPAAQQVDPWGNIRPAEPAKAAAKKPAGAK